MLVVAPALLSAVGCAPASAPRAAARGGAATLDRFATPHDRAISWEEPRREGPVLTPQRSGTAALLQAVSRVSERVVWVSGHEGTWARTLDGGATWESGRVPGADTLQFRDVQGVSADTAYLLASGTGELSRIYTTSDGGKHWTLRLVNGEPRGFWDCFAFWDARRGIVFGDAVDGRHTVLLTDDGGAHWTGAPAGALPPARPGEGGFAASGTCVAAQGRATAWIGTGNGDTAHVLRTTDAGRTWTSAPVPVASGEGAGVTSVAFRDAMHGIAVGGEIGKSGARGDYVATSDDGGRSWHAAGRPRVAGALYGVAWVPDAAMPTAVAVGPGGMDITRDGGRTWTALDTAAYWSVAFASARVGWGVGPQGRIVKVTFR